VTSFGSHLADVISFPGNCASTSAFAMITCGKLGFRQPALYHAVLLFLVPPSYPAALVDTNPN